MQELLKDLNPDQHAAVTLPPRHALILAGAGSGKTRVLTTRIAWLISTRQVSPAGVLAVTFTNKAAREMSTRLSAMLAINPRGMWIGTFHGLCHRMLRAHHREANLPQTFQILDSQDQLAAIKRMIRALESTTRSFLRATSSTSSTAPRKKACARARSRRTTTTRAAASSSTRPTTSSASARVWSISPS